MRAYRPLVPVAVVELVTVGALSPPASLSHQYAALMFALLTGATIWAYEPLIVRSAAPFINDTQIAMSFAAMLAG
jgi:hypothetical protein